MATQAALQVVIAHLLTRAEKLTDVLASGEIVSPDLRDLAQNAIAQLSDAAEFLADELATIRKNS